MVAMGLLMLSVGFELAFQRSYTVDVRGATGWQTVAVSLREDTRAMEPVATRAGDAIEVDRNGTITFRLVVDNGYPWRITEPYDVRYQGVIVAEGVIEAPARGEGTSTFEIPARTFLDSLGRAPETPLQFPYLDVRVDSRYLSGNFQLREADA